MKEFLLQHADRNPVSYHMPGHKGMDIFRKYGYGDFLDRFVDCDITEIPGADNLFQAEGIIQEVQERYAKLYDVKRSYLQINGTSGGLIASVMASVRPGKKLILARNCHKSVFNALILAGIEPVYAQPEFIEEYGISGAVSVEEIEKCMSENPDTDAVILPSPNYYGICSDVEAIAEAVHRENKVLIVLSDGRPNDIIVNRPNSRNPAPYFGDYAVRDTATEVRKVRAEGISVLGVFAGEEQDLMAERRIFGRDFAYIRNIMNFSSVVGLYLRRQLDDTP